LNKNQSIEKLIEHYKEYAKIHFEIDYSDMKSVRRGNKAVNEMIRIACIININYLEHIEIFALMLNDQTHKLDIWVAHHILENMLYTDNIGKLALSVVERYAREDSVEGLGNRMWLRQWGKTK
jgi:hypothetical protein